MKKIKVELEFDENELGEQWMNLDNLAILLYTPASTKNNLLRILSYETK